MRRFLYALLCAMAPLWAAAAAQTADGPGTLHIALREDPDLLDPTLARSFVGRIVFAGLCDKLFDIDAQLNIVPQLATGYAWADPKTLLIHLRAGVQFHDGETMDAAAVKYSLERHLRFPGSFRTPEINAIDHIDTPDAATVRIVLKAPSAPFLSQLTDRAGMILAPRAAAAAGQDFALHPVCAGPFRFTERVAQDRIVLDRFPGYWNAPAIHFDRVVYLPIPDSSVRLANLQAGSIDLAEQIVPSDVAAAQADPRLRLVTSDALGYQGLDINVANGPRSRTPLGQDARVRQALALSIDRTALIQVVYNGMYSPTAQAVPASSPFYVASLPPPPRDLDRARALLRAAGVALPVPVQLVVPNNPDLRQVGEVIQSMAAEAGFDIHITAMEFASWLGASQRGDFEAGLLAWSGRADADGNLWRFLHSGSGDNDGHYSNKEVDSLLDQARAVQDVAQRRALYARMWAQVAQDTPRIYLWIPRNIVGMSARLSGFVAVPDGMIRLQGLQRAP